MERAKMKSTFLNFKKGEEYVLDIAKPPTGKYITVIKNGRSYKIPRDRVALITGMPAPGPATSPGNQSLADLLKQDTPPPSGNAEPAVDLETEAEPEPLPDLPAGQMYLTEFTDGDLPASGVNHVMTIFPKGTWTEEEELFIPEFDDYYHWMPDLLEAVVLGDLESERVLLTGLPGTGKTTAHEQYAAIIRQPFFAINGKDGMEPSSFLGSLGPDGKGGWAWKDGTLPLCMKMGASLCIDEVFKIPAGIQMAMQSLYQRNGRLVLDDKPGTLAEKMVMPAEHFKLNVTDNVKGTGDNFGMFSSTQIQDSSSLDRFGITYTVPYLPESIEVDILERKHPSIDYSHIIKLVQVAALIRGAFAAEDVALTYSLRGLNAACRFVNRGLPVEQAFKLSYLEKLAEESEIETVEGFVTTAGLYKTEEIINV